jgi:hypothetical protein
LERLVRALNASAFLACMGIFLGSFHPRCLPGLMMRFSVDACSSALAASFAPLSRAQETNYLTHSELSRVAGVLTLLQSSAPWCGFFLDMQVSVHRVE